jgi:hypothetical protein
LFLPQGTPLENAKKILLLALTKLPAGSTFNIVAFGSQWLELFPSGVQKSERSLKDAAAFIKVCNCIHYLHWPHIEV